MIDHPVDSRLHYLGIIVEIFCEIYCCLGVAFPQAAVGLPISKIWEAAAGKHDNVDNVALKTPMNYNEHMTYLSMV